LSADSLSYCAEQVRRYDRDRFLTALFAPASRREALFALYAFNLEIAKIRETVREPMMGHIRLQWWRETLDGIETGVARRHEVAEPLAQAIADHDLPRAAFERIVDARMADLEEEPPADLAALIAYAADSSGALSELAAQTLGAGEADLAAARDVGTAYGLIGLTRATAFRARLGRVDLPAGLLAEVGVRPREILDFKGSAGLARVVELVCGEARRLLAAGRAQRAQTSKSALPVLLSAVIAERNLKRLAAAGYDPFDVRLVRADGLAGLALTLAAWRGRY
jgi:NADH dehydrogenase [ubiquinone] 1 alpha subcomplex assembly factor 6